MPEQSLTWQVLMTVPTGTKLEVYARGTGIWLEARVWQGPDAVFVEPTGDGLEAHEVVIRDEYKPEHKEFLAQLVRRPLPKGYSVPPGPYRTLLEDLSRGLTGMIRQSAQSDESLASLPEVKKLVRHMLQSGGFTSDLWTVFKEVARSEFVLSPADDVLSAILQDIRRDKKKP